MLKYATEKRWGGPRSGFGPQPKFPALVRPDLSRWYVVRTDHEKEFTADVEMRLAGFLVFSPSVWCPERRARRDGPRVIPARAACIEPLFRRYVFTQFRLSDDWARIRRLPGVEGILGTAQDCPVPVADEVIEALRSRCSENGCIYPAAFDPDDMRAPIEVGATIRMLSGPMADMTGICQMSTNRRVRVLLEILGRGVSVTVDRTLVEAA